LLLLALCSTASAQYAIADYPGATMPFRIAAGPDGNMWFTDYPSSIGCITPASLVTEYPASATAASHPFGIAAGPDGNLWFTEMTGNQIGSITTSGAVTEYSDGLSPASSPYEITAGPDGNLWFTESTGNRIGSISTSGVIAEYAIPTPKSSPSGIAAGPDGNLWFTEQNGNKIGSITTTGVITEYSAGSIAGSILRGIAAGSDGALWFIDGGHSRIGRIGTDGASILYYSKGLTAGSSPNGIAAGPDGALWFTEGIGARIGRITTDGVITEYSGGITPASNPDGIAAGLDGTVWFTEVTSGRIGRIAIPTPSIAAGGVLSAASYLPGPLSPGDLVSIFGAALGPSAPVLLSLNSLGLVATSLDGVSVSFNGYPAPLIYVGPTQINAIVPYEVAGNSSATVQVTYGTMTSNQATVQLADTAPAIFTMNSSGSGPGAILNQDFSVNTQRNPAPAGTAIQVFLTGEGLTNPAQATGQVTLVNASGSGPLTPAPQLAVAVLIGGQPAHLDFAGEAPDVVAGVLQVNATVPSTAVSGANSIAVKVGTTLSQSGVTVWVK
jgi:uncharacterized protein (TIGR03437 family)